MKRSIAFLLSLLTAISFIPFSVLARESETVSNKDEMPFVDVKTGAWYYNSVLYAYENSLVYGTSATTFAPSVTVDRAMAVSVLARASGDDLGVYTSSRFSDCRKGEYFTQSVEWAADKGIVSGTGNGRFSPHLPLTREQFTVMLVGFLEYKNIGLSSDGARSLFPFTDRSQVSSWAVDAMRRCVTEGLIAGVAEGLLAPKRNCTRAELVSLVHRSVRQFTLFSEYLDRDIILGDFILTDEVPRYVYSAALVRITGFGNSIGRYIPRGMLKDIIPDTPWVAFCEIAVGQGFIIPESEDMLGTGSIKISDAVYGALVAVGYRHFETESNIEYADTVGVTDRYYGSRNESKNLTFGEFAELIDSASHAPMVMQVNRVASEGGEDWAVYQFESKTLAGAYIEGSDLSDGPVKINNTGWDIFNPPGYFYGASMIRNEDGTLDMWAAGLASSRPRTEIDWAYYRRSYDNGQSFTVDLGAGKPTYGTEDWNWVCDPGVFKLGDWYYMGYSSILWHLGADNNLFISRGKNPYDLCEEKWAGYWAYTDATPAIAHDDDYNGWGAGEPSFVVVGDTIYCYISWMGSVYGNGSMTRLYTAPATEDDWPGLLEYTGYCYERANEEDSADIKYVDEYGCFLAFSTADRMTSDSKLTVHLSYDGVTFRTEQIINQGDTILDKIHNCGVTGDEHGHMHVYDSNFLSYAYSKENSRWGSWPNRLAPLALIGSAEYDDPSLSPTRDGDAAVDYDHTPDIVAMKVILNETGTSMMYIGDDKTPQTYKIQMTEKSGRVREATDAEYGAVTYRYNRYQLSIDGETQTITPLNNDFAGPIIMRYGEVYTSIYVKVLRDEYFPRYMKSESPVLTFNFIGERKRPSIIMGDYAGNDLMIWGIICSDDVYPRGASAETANWPKVVTYSGFDNDIVDIDQNTGIITAKKRGETMVRVSAGEFNCNIRVVVK